MDIKKLVSEMTLEEKAMLLSGCAGTNTKDFEELGIPTVSMIDGTNGVRVIKSKVEGGTVCFPTGSTIGATWSKEVAFNVGKALGVECRHEEREVLLGPGVNMKRTPYCGRNFEYFSEDPVQSGLMGASVVNGLESEGIGASVKHYAANSQEYQRMTINAEIDERTLREYYLKSFQVVLENSNLSTVMCAYNKIGGIWCSENKFILTDILRDEWGYDGVMVSDWGAVHDTCRAIKAGLDLDMPGNKNIVKAVKKGIEDGTITMEDIDRSVTRILEFVDRIKKMGKGPLEYEYSREAIHEEAKKAALEGITLLRNDDDVLPITKEKYKKIAVFGHAAERPMIMGAGSAKSYVIDELIDKPIDFMRKYAEEEGIELYYSPVYRDGFMGAEDIGEINNFANLGNDFDAMILFVSDNYGAEVETEYWDRENLTFPNYMNGMIEAACNACKNVIVVMQTGSAPIPGKWHDKVKGIVQMWYSGEAGGSAVSDILFGKENPSGKLGETFILEPRYEMDISGDGRKTWHQEGMFVGYRYYDLHPEKVWFPFGHGLTYTSFEYSDLKLSKTEGDEKDMNVKVSVKVKNVGKRAGKEVVELYVGHKNSVVLKPKKELKGFEKIHLEPGEEKEVTFELTEKDFQYYNICLKDWHVESGKYEISVGASTADIREKAEYSIKIKDDYSIDEVSTKFIMLEA